MDVLRQYALLADGERGVVVGPRGDFAWMCAPRWESGSIFSSLIGGHGLYCVTPQGAYVWGGYYEDGTLIWRSRWTTPDSVIECREALAFPGDPSTAVLLRHVEVHEGSAELDVILRPRADYDRAALRAVHDHGGVWTGRVGDLSLRWSGPQGVSVEPDGHSGHQLHGSVTLSAGQRLDLVLELSTDPFDSAPPVPDDAWSATERGWATEAPPLAVGCAERDSGHARAVLRGLTGASGGMVAAATTSLPEHIEAGRDYDYRYAWIRDQCYAGSAAATAGAYDLLDDAVHFVSARLLEDGPALTPAYTTSGGRVPDQTQLDLAGYPGGGRVLVGNHVNEQFQLDAFGEALLLLASAAEHDRLDADGLQAMLVAADAIEQRWTEPDAGIWELDSRLWSHSRLSCVAGLRALTRAAPKSQDVHRWTALADAMLAEQSSVSLHPSGRWQRADDDTRVDAALLLAGIRGAVAADDPRTIATLDAVRKDLSVGEYVYRYRPDRRPLGEAEGAFLLCGFWMSLACHQQGDQVAAARWFERTRSACGPPGLMTEEFDVTERQLRGNLPQAFVHALLLECAATVDIDTSLSP